MSFTRVVSEQLHEKLRREIYSRQEDKAGNDVVRARFICCVIAKSLLFSRVHWRGERGRWKGSTIKSSTCSTATCYIYNSMISLHFLLDPVSHISPSSFSLFHDFTLLWKESCSWVFTAFFMRQSRDLTQSSFKANTTIIN